MGVTDYLLPDETYRAVTDIEEQDLAGYDGLIIDLDRTLTGYDEEQISPAVKQWYDRLQESHEVCILSNGTDPEAPDRARRIEDLLETTVVRTPSRKPYSSAFEDAVDTLGTDPDRTAVIGDTILTDVLGGNRYGLDTIQIQPRGDTEPFDVQVGRFIGEQLQALARSLRQL